MRLLEISPLIEFTCDDIFARKIYHDHLERYSKEGNNSPWCGYMLWDDFKSKYVGHCRFTAPPALGKVYIKIDVFPGEEGQGYGRFMCNALVSKARAQGTDVVIVSRTENAEMPPARILAKCGFKIARTVYSTEGQEMWEWEL